MLTLNGFATRVSEDPQEFLYPDMPVYEEIMREPFPVPKAEKGGEYL